MSRDVDTSALFTPLTVRGVTLSNRIVMSPMTRNFATGGVPGPDVAAYYRRRADAEVGLILTEGVGVDHPSAIGEGGMGQRQADIPLMYGDAALAGWKNVVDEVHAVGGVIFPQLWHMGVYRVEGMGPHPEARSIRPSGVWGPPGRKTSSAPEFVEKLLPPSHVPTDEEIQDVVDGYGRSAAHAAVLGFDGVAIHGAHGYLIDTFLWPETNLRTGRWAGGGPAKTAFAEAVVRAIRDAIGPDRPIVFRYSQWKQQDFQATLAATPQELAQVLEPLAGAGVDVFDVSTRNFDWEAFEGSDLSLAGWTRKLTGRTTIAVGGVSVARLGKIESVENLDRVMFRFERGEFDLIAVGRALLSDPQWARKARTGEAFIPFRTEAYDELH